MQRNLKQAEINLTKHHKHQNEFNQQLAQEIVKSGLKQSHDKLQSLISL
ncbi:hypothetical protein J828_4150, partial [Acinetobacter baumannii 25691_5]